MPLISDAVMVPGNADLDDEAKAARIAAIHEPYQAAIGNMLAKRDSEGRVTYLISLHSFTPVMGGVARSWDIGVLHEGGDAGFALSLLVQLRRRHDLMVGDNEPYRMDATDHTVPRHAYPALRPYAELEIRQDHLADAPGQARWAEWLADALLQALD